MAAMLAMTAAIAALDAAAQTKERVLFARGANSTEVKGTASGFAFRDHVVGGSAGQSIDIRLASPNTFSVFTIFLPNGDNLEGAAQVDEFSGELPVSGDYVVRVAMMRAEARRGGSVSNYSLRISIR